MVSFCRASALALLAAASLAATACDDDGVGQSSADATDSFGKPTIHGELRFGLDEPARITATERFHAWTFELTGDAEVDLRTVGLASNLDTVLYLYRRESSSSTWGSYVAKNDDDGEELSSKVAKKLGAGEYLVKVKATKTAMRGDFALRGTCTGAGCPAAGDCEDGARASLPGETAFTAACSDAVTDVLLAEVTRDDSFSARFDASCDAGALGAAGMALYRAYWTDEVGWSEFDEENAETEATVRVLEHGDAGATVEVDIGADEDHVTFVFDGESKLLALYHSEQSSRSAWYCGSGGDEAETPPDDCLGNALRGLSHGAGKAVTSAGTVTSADAEDLGWAAPLAARHADAHGLGDTASIEYELASWATVDGEEGAELTLGDGATATTYLLLNDGSSVTILSEGDAPLACTSL